MRLVSDMGGLPQSGVPVMYRPQVIAPITIDTWANRPLWPIAHGSEHNSTDAPSRAIWDGTNWNHFIGPELVVPPVLGNFTQVNFGTSSTASYGPYTSLIPGIATPNHWRLLTIAVPSLPYKAEAGFYLPQTSQGTASPDDRQFGIGWRDNSGNILLTFVDTTSAPVFRGVHWPDPNNNAGTPDITDITILPRPSGLFKFRIREDSSFRYIDLQQGMNSWYQIFSVTRTTFLTATQVVVCFQQNNNAYSDRIHWVHYNTY